MLENKQREIEDFLDEYEIGESLIDGRRQSLGSYMSGINWTNLTKAMKPLKETFTLSEITEAANGLIEEGYLSPNFTLLGRYLLRNLEN